jgi:hypothetical protein
MMRTVASLLAVVVVAGGCSSPEEKLFALRREQRKDLDALYARYGGGALAHELQGELNKPEVRAQTTPSGTELVKMIGNAVGEFDRAAFEVQCESVGAGGRADALNDKANAFFASPDVIDACGEVAEREVKINALEREIAAP